MVWSHGDADGSPSRSPFCATRRRSDPCSLLEERNIMNTGNAVTDFTQALLER